MWVMEKGGKTVNTFLEETKNKLEKEGWKVKLDTLAKEKKNSKKNSEEVV